MSLTRSTSVLNETSNYETILFTICVVDHLSNVNPTNHHHSFPPSNASQDPRPQPITIAPALADSTHPSLILISTPGQTKHLLFHQFSLSHFRIQCCTMA
ncbi:hypothetical protein FRC02_005345 [Tulasnella sp. 418]|nr:hypothetical protein FRC02_005345 [Tulasnella sp. 418]